MCTFCPQPTIWHDLLEGSSFFFAVPDSALTHLAIYVLYTSGRLTQVLEQEETVFSKNLENFSLAAGAGHPQKRILLGYDMVDGLGIYAEHLVNPTACSQKTEQKREKWGENAVFFFVVSPFVDGLVTRPPCMADVKH